MILLGSTICKFPQWGWDATIRVSPRSIVNTTRLPSSTSLYQDWALKWMILGLEPIPGALSVQPLCLILWKPDCLSLVDLSCQAKTKLSRDDKAGEAHSLLMEPCCISSNTPWTLTLSFIHSYLLECKLYEDRNLTGLSHLFTFLYNSSWQRQHTKLIIGWVMHIGKLYTYSAKISLVCSICLVQTDIKKTELQCSRWRCQWYRLSNKWKQNMIFALDGSQPNV